MQLKVYHLASDGTFRSGLGREEAVKAYRSGDGLVWIDILDPTEDDLDFYEQDLGFHHLRAESCISPEPHVPTVDDLEGYVFLNAHGVDYTVDSDVVFTTELSIFFGKTFVVTSHNVALYAVGLIAEAVGQDGRLMRIGADLLVHALLDALVGGVQLTIDKMLEHADAVEEEALRQPRRATVEAVLKLRRSALGLYRAMSAQQGLLNRMARGDFDSISPKALPYFRDVHEQLWRTVELTQAVRERADSALATYMSSVANRQNESMRLLATVAAIFLPLSLLAGIYGMNFDNMPELGWPWAYFAVLGVMGAVILGMVFAFCGRWWLGWGQRRITQVRRVRPFAVELEEIVEGLGSRIYRLADALYPFNTPTGRGKK